MNLPGSGRVVVSVAAEDTPFCATGIELVADRLFGLGASAVSELSADTFGLVRLVADLPVGSIDALAVSGLEFTLLEADPTWSDGWKEHARVVLVGERLAVRPEWVRSDPDLVGDRIEVVLDAADAFGSCSHPTTRLCLGAIERILRSGDRVLDVGSGTGVLGVSALMLGAASLVAVDVEPAAVAATSRSVELNHVMGRLVEVSSRSVGEVTTEHGPFDLVLANLLIPTIEELGADLANSISTGGRLVLSGVLVDQVERAVRALGSRHAVREVLEEAGWAAVIVGL